MAKTVLTFIHGVNEHLPVRDETRRWRKALAAGGADPETLGLHSTFGYYADWFFKGSGRAAPLPPLPPVQQDILNEAAARMEGPLSAVPSDLPPDAREAMGGLDLTTFIPQRIVRAFLEQHFRQLFLYFDNAPITHPSRIKDDKPLKGRARDVIRAAVLEGLQEARQQAGPEGRVIVLAHSMGSIVAWDLLAHAEDCPEVDGLITFGSPLALDFIQRGLRRANGDAYNQRYPARLKGDWVNLVARHDLAGQFDTDFKREFGRGSVDHTIHHREIDNPELVTGQGLVQLVRSAHGLTGYLRHPQMIWALDMLGDLDLTRHLASEAPETSRRGERRADAVRRASAQRFRETEARRNQIRAGRAGAMGIAQIETRDRLVKKLRLMDVPQDLAETLVEKARRGSDTGSINLERILGSRDFLPSNFALKAAALTAAVGKLVVSQPGLGTWVGTGFMVSENLLMTNHHVIGSQEQAANAVFHLDYNLSSEEEERRAFQVRLRPEQFFITSEAHKLDYTIVAVDVPEGGLMRPWFQLIEGSGKALMHDHVNILQHPDGRRQEIALRNSQVIFVDEDKDYAYYQADTEGGSSGSPVCNDQWQLAFLHHASVPRDDPRASVLTAAAGQVGTQDSGTRGPWVSNEGIRISRIVRDARTKILDEAQNELFLACFRDPDLTRYIHIAPRTLQGGPALRPGEASGPLSPMGPSGIAPNGLPYQHHPDGGTSYLFQLSFGPAGQPRGMLPASIPPAPPAANPPRPSPPRAFTAPSAPASFTPSGPKDAVLRDAAQRLIDGAQRDEEYYDANRDAASIAAYYADLPDTSPVAMYDQYRALLRSTHTTEFSYTNARHKVLYPSADRHEDGTLKSVYSGEALDAADIITQELAMILRSADLPLLQQDMLLEGSWLDLILTQGDRLEALESQGAFNCEHVVPQSWFNKRQPMKADLHHLFTCEPRCNSFRSNFAYGEFEQYDAGQLDPQEAALRQMCGYRDLLSGAERFEPERNKGAVARATLYFLLRYPGEIGDADNEYGEASLDTLLRWHDCDPPGLWEQHRNRVIFLAQGNRNPLIDRPELGGKIAFRKGLGEL